MKNSLVTVAMVTYNSAKFVGLAIESVLASSYENFELIICDDCSKDATREVIKSFTDDRIKLHFNDSNLGEYPNRNKCLSHAKGKYIIYIDGDDLIYPNGLEHIVKNIEAFPGVGMALALQWRDYIFYPYCLKPRENMLFTYFGESFLNTSFAQTLFNTEILKRVGGLSNEYRSGDSYIKKLISIEYKVILVNGPIAWWRRTPGQASTKLAGSVGIVENFKIDKEIINNKLCPLEKEEKELIINTHHNILLKHISINLLKLKLKSAIELFKLVAMKKAFLGRKIDKKMYKCGATSAQPLMLPFSDYINARRVI